MTGRRAYNEKRSDLNKKCREKLSGQLYNRLGLKIEPSQVRLKTENTDDPYVWERTEDLEHIFQKNFSDLSTGSLMRLYEALDENLKVNALRKKAGVQVSQHLGFKAEIGAQQQRIDQLNEEVQMWKEKAESEAQKRQGIQLEMDRLLDRLKDTEEKGELFERELNEWKSIARYLREGIVKCQEGASVVMKVADSLKSTPNAFKGQNVLFGKGESYFSIMIGPSILAVIGFVSVVTVGAGYPRNNTINANNSSGPLKSIEQEAHGSLFNASLPLSVSNDSLTDLQLIAFNELFEVAFFEQLLFNLTNHVDGFELNTSPSGSFVTDTILTVQNQEELHALHANQLLQRFGADPIQPCNYSFPVSTLDDAIEFAALFTSINLGTLQEVARTFAQSGDDALIPGLTSLIGQEGEQEAFYRILQDKVPSELPFLTSGNRDFTFTALQKFVVPGSCSVQDDIPLNTFPPLELITTPIAETTMIQFAYNSGMYCAGNGTLFAVFINQQNPPIVETITVHGFANGTVTAKTEFPYSENEMNGLTIMTLTNTSGPFEDAAAVARFTQYGPTFFIVN
ncbi:hypothetical protein ZTR_09541 [Talaromyces verruculosus]|nr:hypothetical protein ZTR_09541 [Talaromyces verruculosus]